MDHLLAISTTTIIMNHDNHRCRRLEEVYSLIDISGNSKGRHLNDVISYREASFIGSFLPNLPGAVCVGEKIQSLLFMLQAQFPKGSSDFFSSTGNIRGQKPMRFQWRCRMPMTVDHFWFDHFSVVIIQLLRLDNGQGVGVQQGGDPWFSLWFSREFPKVP